ncbi:MAG TPA: 2-succinyl-5-enolpyruvyl-6-hydroxy-3-cyclohexene-1-carboxylic-acid synthase, partial [Streptosporangiaceae bacterium]
EAVLAPGSRSAPLAIALWDRSASPGGRPHAPLSPGTRESPARSGNASGAPRPAAEPGAALRLHVRIDERSAAFLALGLAKASGRPVALVCTSGTAAANFHPAVIEADESGVPLLVMTADRPPELRGTGANQTIDQLKLYGGAVRWFAEAGVPEARPGMNAYWRSLAGRAWAAAAGADGGFPGPVHLNLPLRDPLVPGLPDAAAPAGAGTGGGGWPEPLDGRPGGAPWTRWAGAGQPGTLDLPWAERGVIVAGDGVASPAGLLRLAAAAGWPVLAEPSSGARLGRHALGAYQYLLEHPGFLAAHRPDLVICAGRPGLSRGQTAFLRRTAADGARQVVLAQGPGRWADPARTVTDAAAAVRLAGAPAGPGSGWLGDWQAADAAARGVVDAVLDASGELTEPRLARDLAAALPDGSLLWAASSLPVRDLDRHLAPRDGLRVLASRGASGIDGLISSASGAALAHQASGGGPAAALLGDLAFLHDSPGLFAGPEEARPDLVLVVANNDGGGIFSALEQAAVPAPFERVFGTPHGANLAGLAAAAGIRHAVVLRAGDLPAALKGDGIRIVEVPADRAAGTALRRRLAEAAAAAVTALL